MFSWLVYHFKHNVKFPETGTKWKHRRGFHIKSSHKANVSCAFTRSETYVPEQRGFGTTVKCHQAHSMAQLQHISIQQILDGFQLQFHVSWHLANVFLIGLLDYIHVRQARHVQLDNLIMTRIIIPHLVGMRQTASDWKRHQGLISVRLKLLPQFSFLVKTRSRRQPWQLLTDNSHSTSKKRQP